MILKQNVNTTISISLNAKLTPLTNGNDVNVHRSEVKIPVLTRKPINYLLFLAFKIQMSYLFSGFRFFYYFFKYLSISVNVTV